MILFSQKAKSREAGFTVIEMLVSASLLIAAMTFVLVIFLDSLAGQRKVISFEQASNNARFLLDSISREIRVSIICGYTGGARPCYAVENNTPAVVPGTSRPDVRLDIIRSVDNAHISYCIWRTSVLDDNQLELRRLVNNADFTVDPCGDIAPAGTQILQSPEVALLPGSGFITVGVGQTPPANPNDCRPNTASPQIDICQPRVTIILWVQSVTQKDPRERSDIRVQTTLSQRLIDIP